ncbi:MAG TPA: response regulator, partial [Armatimonadetes bacterium]|nr:response regulator [Armatimonadota bacterium]
GMGMSEEERRRIFEPFFTTKPAEKLGLGLTVAYGIIRQHGGEIHIESELGSGTTVRIMLPPAELQPQQPDSTHRTREDRALPDAIPPMLIISSEETLQHLIANILRRDGYEAVVRPTGKLGLEALAERNFALVIADSDIPEGGIEIVRQIKQQRPDIPIIIITEVGEQPTLAELVRAGVRQVLTRPFHLSDFRQALQEALSSRHITVP